MSDLVDELKSKKISIWGTLKTIIILLSTCASVLLFLFSTYIMPLSRLPHWIKYDIPLDEKVDNGIKSPEDKIKIKNEEIYRLKELIGTKNNEQIECYHQNSKLYEENIKITDSYQDIKLLYNSCYDEKINISGILVNCEEKNKKITKDNQKIRSNCLQISNNLLEGKRIAVYYDDNSNKKAAEFKNELIRNGASPEPILKWGNMGLKPNKLYYCDGNDMPVASRIIDMLKDKFDNIELSCCHNDGTAIGRFNYAIYIK